MSEHPRPAPAPNPSPNASLSGWLEERLKGLHAELSRGEQMLRALDAQRQEIRGSMLRIEGAIQALQEARVAGAHAPAGAPPAHGIPPSVTAPGAPHP